MGNDHSDTGCLSTVALERLASGQRGPTAAEAAHLETCPLCAAQVGQDTKQVSATGQAPMLPTAPAGAAPSVGHGPRRTTGGGLRWSGVAALAIIAVGLALRQLTAPAPSPTAGFALKGRVQVGGTVRSPSGALQNVTDISDAKIGRGDIVEVRVQASPGTQVVLQDPHTHATYYDGKATTDGWLPVGVSVDALPFHLHVRVCDMTSKTCQESDVP